MSRKVPGRWPTCWPHSRPPPVLRTLDKARGLSDRGSIATDAGEAGAAMVRARKFVITSLAIVTYDAPCRPASAALRRLAILH